MNMDDLRLRIGNVANALRMIRTQAGRLSESEMLRRIESIEAALAGIDGDIYREVMDATVNQRICKKRVLCSCEVVRPMLESGQDGQAKEHRGPVAAGDCPRPDDALRPVEANRRGPKHPVRFRQRQPERDVDDRLEAGRRAGAGNHQGPSGEEEHTQRQVTSWQVWHTTGRTTRE